MQEDSAVIQNARNHVRTTALVVQIWILSELSQFAAQLLEMLAAGTICNSITQILIQIIENWVRNSKLKLIKKK